MPTAPRTEKLDLRLSPQAKQRIAAAAEVENRTVSDFVLTTLMERVDEVLAERRNFSFTAEQWEKLQEILDAPPRDLSRMRRLMTEPSIFEKSGKP